MAKTRSPRGISRRDAVALLGAGTVLGTIGADVEAAAPGAVQDHPSCDKPMVVDALQRGIGTPPRLALVSYSCCDETRNAVLVGVEEPMRKPTSRGKAHLKPLQTRLSQDNLEEYCFMIWGLSEEQVMTLRATVTKELGFAPRAAATLKK
jgi:hypothetical protein